MKQTALQQAAALFWLKVRRTDYCWFWTGAVNKSGYGVCGSVGLGSQLAHRAAWLLVRGKISEGFSLCHICDNKRCVNPNHLYVGTHQQNMRDLWTRKPPRRRIGSQVSTAVLAAIDVVEIRARAAKGEKFQAIADRFGVTWECISAVVKRKTWRHISENVLTIDRTKPITRERLALEVRRLLLDLSEPELAVEVSRYCDETYGAVAA